MRLVCRDLRLYNLRTPKPEIALAGQIIARGKNTWLVRIPLSRENGKRRYHNHTVKGTKRDAQRYLSLKLTQKFDGRFIQSPRTTFGEWLQTHLDTVVKLRVRPKTFEDYNALARRHVLPSLGGIRLADLNVTDLQAHYSRLLEAGYAVATVRQIHSIIHGALQRAVKARLIAFNAAKDVELPSIPRAETRAMSTSEAARFMDACAGDRFEALWKLLISTGLRPSEALGLKWSDFSDQGIAVKRSLGWSASHQWHLHDTKTANARRTVTVPSSTMNAILAHRDRQQVEQLIAGDRWLDLDLVFTTSLGGPLEYRVIVRKHLKPILKVAGLGEFRPYDLRHTCATLLMEAGEHVKVVSERLGHASTAFTLDTYTHVQPTLQRQSADVLERLLYSSGAEPGPDAAHSQH